MISYGDTIKCGIIRIIQIWKLEIYSGKNLEFIFDFDNNKIITDTLGGNGQHYILKDLHFSISSMHLI